MTAAKPVLPPDPAREADARAARVRERAAADARRRAWVRAGRHRPSWWERRHTLYGDDRP